MTVMSDNVTFCISFAMSSLKQPHRRTKSTNNNNRNMHNQQRVVQKRTVFEGLIFNNYCWNKIKKEIKTYLQKEKLHQSQATLYSLMSFV